MRKELFVKFNFFFIMKGYNKRKCYNTQIYHVWNEGNGFFLKLPVQPNISNLNWTVSRIPRKERKGRRERESWVGAISCYRTWLSWVEWAGMQTLPFNGKDWYLASQQKQGSRAVFVYYRESRTGKHSGQSGWFYFYLWIFFLIHNDTVWLIK